MTVRDAVEQLFCLSVGFMVALAVVMAWPESATPTPGLLAFIGLGLLLIVPAFVGGLVFKRSLFGQSPSERRPLRYSIPFAVAYLIAFFNMPSGLFGGPPAPGRDDFVGWFAVAGSLLIGGWFLSNLLWVLNSRPRKPA